MQGREMKKDEVDVKNARGREEKMVGRVVVWWYESRIRSGMVVVRKGKAAYSYEVCMYGVLPIAYLFNESRSLVLIGW